MALAFAGFLAGLAALSVPIILHFLRHKPTKNTPFPALRFLKATLARRAARNKLRKWLVLLLRCLCLAALVLAFCMPYIARFAQQPDEATVVLWDNSFSMQADPYAASLRDQCLKELATADPAHPMLLGVVSDKVVWSGKFSGNASELRSTFQAINPGEGTSSFETALRLADARLAVMPASVKKIVLITDHQALPWKTLQWKKTLSPGTRLSVLSPQAGGFINAAITELTLKTPFRGPNTKVVIEAHLENFSDTPLQGTLIPLLDGEIMTPQDVTLPPHTKSTQSIELLGDKSHHGVEVRLNVEDELATDNQRWIALNTTTLPTLCASAISSSQTDFLQLAFNPSLESTSVNWIEWNKDLPPEPIKQADLLIVRDGFMLQSEAGKAFQETLNSGGSAVILWNDTPELRHLLLQFGVEAELLPKKETKELDFIDFDHPVFKPFLEAQVGGFFNILFFNPPVLKVPDRAQRLANFKDGTPAIAEIAVGKGRLLVVASGMDRTHTDWPTHATYLPFWREVMDYYQKEQEKDRTLFVSATPLQIPGLQQAQSMESGETIAIENSALPAEKSGNYLLNADTDPQVVSINVPSAESDPAQLDESFEWEKMISMEPAEARRATDQPIDQGKSFWHALFMVAILAALGEMLIANRTVL
jgi:hypothetical protein